MPCFAVAVAALVIAGAYWTESLMVRVAMFFEPRPAVPVGLLSCMESVCRPPLVAPWSMICTVKNFGVWSPAAQCSVPRRALVIRPGSGVDVTGEGRGQAVFRDVVDAERIRAAEAVHADRRRAGELVDAVLALVELHDLRQRRDQAVDRAIAAGPASLGRTI